MQNKQEVKVEKQSKKNAGFVFLIIMLIAIIMVTSSMGLYAWARYNSKTPGNTTGQVAKWHFELKPGKVEGTRLENFAITRTDGHSYVVSEKLAPGTYGVIPIEIDTTETEVTMTYEVKVQLKDCPANIKFYKDSGKTEQLERTKVTIEGEIYDVITISKYLSLDMVGEEPNKHTEVNDVHNETIYWEWPYQTIIEENGVQNAVAGDLQDTQDQGKTVMMNIVATGIQVTEKPLYLADMVRNGDVKIGDVVLYDATKGLTAGQIATEGLGKYTAPGTVEPEEIAAQTGTGHSSAQTFNVNGITSWKVLGINERGEVELLGIISDNLTLKGQAGYNNGQDILEGIASIYGHGAGATGARAMKVEDVDKYTTFNKTGYREIVNNTRYGQSRQYPISNLHAGVEFEVESAEDENGNITIQKITNESSLTVQQTYYQYLISNFKKTEIPLQAYDMLTENNYWLDSRSNTFTSSVVLSFGLRWVVSGTVYASSLFNNRGGENPCSAAVPSIVSLRSDIQVKGGDSNGWRLDV